MELKYSLKELRARHNWTQAETAKRIGISTQAYNAWEQNFSNVRLHNAVKAADVFNVNLDELKIFNDEHELNSCE